MKEEPASPDQRVPSQSKTAICGEREWTRAWKSGVERRTGAAGSWDKKGS
jgi:hypothetical protein